MATYKSPLIFGIASLVQQSLNFSPVNRIYTGKLAFAWRKYLKGKAPSCVYAQRTVAPKDQTSCGVHPDAGSQR